MDTSIMSPEDIKDFEKGRIKALQEERLHIQKKTFTKWMNSFLQKAKMQVDDLFTDLGDGRKLLKLLEIISGEKLGKPNSGKMRVHRIENVNKSLAFLHTKVRLENIGAEDVVDGNPRMILGLIWTIILRFQIQEIEINLDEDDEREGSVKKSAKDALLLWCQRKTNGYQNVQIDNFTTSWQSGLGFNALIHHHRPDLINFNQLRPDDHLNNLRNAFDVAEKHLGIPKLLDAEDVDVSRPDEKSVMTYVASYYHTFSKMKAGATGGKRIGNIISKIKAIDDQKLTFESYSTELLLWIKMKIGEIKKRDFPNSLEEIQLSLKQFKDYRMREKPPKYQEKVEIEATYFDIQIKLQQLRQAAYLAPEGQRPHDIEQAGASGGVSLYSIA
jgi:spectrin beta